MMLAKQCKSWNNRVVYNIFKDIMMQVRLLKPLVALTLPLLLITQANAQTTSPNTTTTTVVTSSTTTTAPLSNTYTLDPNHSYVLWHINHFGFSNPSGKWMANGTLVFDKNHPQDSQVTATVNIAEGVTGIPELDKHMQSADFFDAAQFPTATFVSDKVKVTGKDKADVTGQLTMHGVTKPLTFHVTLNKIGVSLVSNKPTIGFSGTAELNRSDFGISGYAPGLSAEIPLEIEVEASPATSQG